MGGKIHFVGLDPLQEKLVSIVVDITSHMATNSLSRENLEEQTVTKENRANSILNFLYHIFDKVRADLFMELKTRELRVKSYTSSCFHTIYWREAIVSFVCKG